MDRYSEMEMTKIARAEFKRGKREQQQADFEMFEKMIDKINYPKDCIVYPVGRWNCAKLYIEELKALLENEAQKL